MPIMILTCFFNVFYMLLFDKFDPSTSCSQNWLKFSVGVHCYVLIMISLFEFLPLRHIFTQYLMLSKLNELDIEVATIFACRIFFPKWSQLWSYNGPKWSQTQVIMIATDRGRFYVQTAARPWRRGFSTFTSPF